MNRKPIFLSGFILCLALLTACHGSKGKTNLNKGTPVPSPDAEKTTVIGSVFSTTTNKPYPGASVWLAEVYRQGGEGAYVLDSVASPGVYADEEGVFVIANVDPKEYVIVIGNPEGAYEVIPDDKGRARVWQTEAGKILDVGQLKVKLVPPPTPKP